MACQTPLIQYAVMYLYIPYILLARGENCPQSIPTVAVVDDCPQNAVEWVKRMELKKCNFIIQNCTTLDNFEYHCLTNKFQHIFVEVCAPNKMIVGQNCPYYDVQHNSINYNLNQPCKEHKKPCPSVYTSSSVYLYQECYNEARNSKAHSNDNLRNGDSSVPGKQYFLQLQIKISWILAILFTLFMVVLIYICWPKKSSRLKQMCNAIQQRMLGKSPLTHDEESEELNANQPETTTEVSTD